MTEPEELQHRERSSRGGCLFVGAIVLFVFYFLSPPFVSLAVYYIVVDTPLEGPVFNILEIVYFPIGWAYENLDWVQSFYNWYDGLFEFL